MTAKKVLFGIILSAANVAVGTLLLAFGISLIANRGMLNDKDMILLVLAVLFFVMLARQFRHMYKAHPKFETTDAVTEYYSYILHRSTEQVKYFGLPHYFLRLVALFLWLFSLIISAGLYPGVQEALTELVDGRAFYTIVLYAVPSPLSFDIVTACYCTQVVGDYVSLQTGYITTVLWIALILAILLAGAFQYIRDQHATYEKCMKSLQGGK